MPSDRRIRILQESRDEALELCTWVKTRRETLGVSQELLAEMSGVPRSYISQIENGLRPLTSIQHLVRLVKALNANLNIEET